MMKIKTKINIEQEIFLCKSAMKTGDLVTKIGGYGAGLDWVGIVIGVVSAKGGKKLVVLHDGEIENWYMKMTKIIS